MIKTKEKLLAVKLRKQGKTYNEILDVVDVSKSTLSLWLRDVGLAKRQHQRVTAKKYAAQLKGAQTRKDTRIAETKEIFDICQKEIGSVSDRDLFMVGVALYWAEGVKEKEYRPSVRVDFANSDPLMVEIFMKWIRTFADIPDSDIKIIIHLHINHKHRIKELENYWLQVTGLQYSNLGSTLYKKHNPKTKRKKTGETYKGLVAIRIKRSTILNRRIQGWVHGIIYATK